MSNDENKFQPIFQILHIKSAWFLLELAMALVTTIGMRFLQVWAASNDIPLYCCIKIHLRQMTSPYIGASKFTCVKNHPAS